MIHVICLGNCLSDIENLMFEEKYRELIKPLNYQFDLLKDKVYRALGVLIRHGTPWLYVTSQEKNVEVQLVPAELFFFEWSQIPSNWLIRILNNSLNSLEILPKALACFDNWYERYIDEDEQILNILLKEVEEVPPPKIS